MTDRIALEIAWIVLTGAFILFLLPGVVLSTSFSRKLEKVGDWLVGIGLGIVFADLVFALVMMIRCVLAELAGVG